MKSNKRKSQTGQRINSRPQKAIFISEKSSFLPLLLAFCIPVIVYLQTVKFEFSGFDDYLIILNNYNFLSDLGNVPHAFLKDAFIGNRDSLYRPLQTISYMLDIQLSGGNNPFMYHLTNILLLGLISSLLFLILRRFLVAPKIALLTTLIFCVHPLFVSTIAWIPARGELLLSAFSLLSFLFLMEFLRKRKIVYLVIHWITFTIALFCKETAALLPVVFILYYFTFSFNKQFKKTHLLVIALYAISGLFWIWLRSRAIGDYSDSFAVIGFSSFLSNLRTIPESLVKFILPFDLAPIPSFSLLKTAIGTCILVLLIIILFRNKEKSLKEKIFCLAWFLILMLPPMVFKHPLIDYLDHRFFLPLTGVLLFLLFTIPEKWIENHDIQGSWVLIILIAFVSTLTVFKSRAYADPMTFFNTAIAKNSNSAISYYNRGANRINRNDFQGAIEDNTKAIEIYPVYEMAFVNRGIAKGNTGDLQGAIADFDSAITLNNSDIDAYTNRGYAKQVSGNLKEAIADFDMAITIRPNDSKAYNSKGGALAMSGNYRDAMVNFTKAIEHNPNYLDAYYNRALTKFSLKDFPGAIMDCNSVLRLNPDNGNALKLRGQCEQALKNSVY